MPSLLYRQYFISSSKNWSIVNVLPYSSYIILSNLIEPKLKKTDLLKLPLDTIKYFVEEIFNSSFDNPVKDFEINKKLVEYENSIFYNDIVISKIVDFYKNKDAVIIYISDHSEGMFAPGINNNWGRSSFAEIDYANAYENFQIPMWIYTTDTYILLC